MAIRETKNKDQGEDCSIAGERQDGSESKIEICPGSTRKAQLVADLIGARDQRRL